MARSSLVRVLGFVLDTYGCRPSPSDPRAFDHFGTFTSGPMQLTITQIADVPQTAAPEPRFEAAAGLLALLSIFGRVYRARRSGAK
ncbi:MAG: hypothetical protein ACJ746_11955 [Bryobacteraceae bacterium]